VQKHLGLRLAFPRVYSQADILGLSAKRKGGRRKAYAGVIMSKALS